jgi:Cdc6-like AAA superfamily ATPase
MQGGSSRGDTPAASETDRRLDRTSLLYDYSVAQNEDVTNPVRHGTKGKGRQSDVRGHSYSHTVARDNSRVHTGDVYNYHNHSNIAHRKQRSILDWLTTLDPSHSHNQACRQHQEGTLGWFFDIADFKAWRDDWGHRTPQTLWCRGDMGAGKTTLFAQIVSHLQSSEYQTCGLAVVYCRSSEQHNQTAETIFGSILAQLYYHDDDIYNIPGNVKEAFDRIFRRLRRPKLKELEDWLDQRLQFAQPVYVLLDALDEMKSAYRRQLLRSLQSKSYSALKLLVTSRNIPEIGWELPERLEIEICARESDLQTFIHARLHEQGTESFREGVLERPSKVSSFPTIEEEISFKVIDSAKTM